MGKKYDIGIIGAGISGAFAALRAAENHRKASVIIFDLGRPPGKRRRQLEGWLGCFPTGDAKIRVNDVEYIRDTVDGRTARHANNWIMNHLKEIGPFKVTYDKLPQPSVQKQISTAGFEIIKNDYIQWKPDSVHKLSRVIADKLEEAGNVEFSFDNEVFTITKQKRHFIIGTTEGDYWCRKIILCVGRSGWRWVSKLYEDLGLSVHDDLAKYGIRVEMPTQYLKEYNKSHCSLIRSDLSIGPFCFNGTIIPEDHADLAISAFRSNENRWKSDKVSFKIIGNRLFKGRGIYETDRLGKLAFLQFNDRIGRERVKNLVKKRSLLSDIPEYNWLIETVEELESFIPNIINRGYFHVPTISPIAAPIRLGSNLETELEGMFVAGESAGFPGIGSAAISGAIAIDGALKK